MNAILLTDGLLIAGGMILVAAAMHDVGFRTVPNVLPLALCAVGLWLRLVSGGVLTGLGLALLVFGLATLAWSRGWMGGGDVKLLAASALFVPPGSVADLLLITAIAGAFVAISYWLGGRLVPAPGRARPASLWRRALRCEQWRLRRRAPIPYAVAILIGAACVSVPV